MAAVWVVLTVPSVLWWGNSVKWVIVISLYANFASELAVAAGFKAERSASKDG